MTEEQKIVSEKPASKKMRFLPTYHKIKSIIPLPNNPRTITAKDFKKLVKSVKENDDYLEAHPIVLSNRTGDKVVIDGNQRLRAAIELEMTEIPAVLLTGLTEKREREIVIRANVTNGIFDLEMLANEWEAENLDEWGVYLPDWSAPEDMDDGGEDEDDAEKKGRVVIKCLNEEKGDIIDFLNIKFKETAYKNIVIE